MRTLVRATFTVVLLTSVVALADVLVLTDREQLDTFADTVTGAVDIARIDQALSYVDTDREQVTLSIAGEPDVHYVDGDGAELATELRDALELHMGREIEGLSRSLEVDGDEGRVALRVRTPDSVVDATFDLVKHGERWLVHRIRLR